MKRLIIAEKPSVAQAIAAVLNIREKKPGYLEGADVLVSWCAGHLVELAAPEGYDARYARWRQEDLPIVPGPWRYEVIEKSARQFETLKRLMRRADVFEVVNACDAGARASSSSASSMIWRAAISPSCGSGPPPWRKTPSARGCGR